MKNQMDQLKEMNPETNSGENCRFSWEWCYGGKSCLKSGVILTIGLTGGKKTQTCSRRKMLKVSKCFISK